MKIKYMIKLCWCFLLGRQNKTIWKKLVCKIRNTDLLSESVCGNLQPRFAQAQCEPTGNDSDYGRAAWKRKKSWWEKLRSCSTLCGWGSGGSLLFDVLVKEFLDLEHGMRGFFHPSISGGQAKRAEKWCGGIGFRGLKLLEITAAWVWLMASQGMFMGGWWGSLFNLSFPLSQSHLFLADHLRSITEKSMSGKISKEEMEEMREIFCKIGELINSDFLVACLPQKCPGVLMTCLCVRRSG